MLGKLAYRNAKRSIKDYLIYLITITLSFSLILAFNLVASSDEEGYDVVSRSYGGTTLYVGMNICVCRSKILGAY